MEAMRASPRASGARRVLATKRGRPDGASANTARKLQRREVAAGPGRALSPSFRRERFRDIQLQEEFDTHDPVEKSFFLLSHLRERSQVAEIVEAHDIIFALSHSGVCTALSRVTKQRICILNGSPDEVIRSIFYNKGNNSLITVSVYASEEYKISSCRTTPIEYIRQAMPDAGFPLFKTELLNDKSFVEVDDVNGKVMIYVDQDSTYKVFDWKNYTPLYTIPGTNIKQIKFCPGILVLIYERKESYIQLEVLSIEDGKSLKSLKHLLHRTKRIEFMEQFDEKFFIKQEGENLKILDTRDSNLVEVSSTKFVNPTNATFLERLQLFMAFHGRSLSVWNFHGEPVTYFEDHVLQYPDCTRCLCITGNQDIVASYCRADSDDPSDARSININEILTGKSLAKIKASGLRRQKKTLEFQNTPSEALMDVTALYYDEEHEEIYTGNSEGLVHMWSS